MNYPHYSLSQAKLLLTCCVNETDALFNEDGDWPLRSDNCGQWHTKVVAFDGFGDGMPGFVTRFLRERKIAKTRLVGALKTKKNNNPKTPTLFRHRQMFTK